MAPLRVTVLAAVVVVAAAHAAGPKVEVVATGKWSGHTWTLSASNSGARDCYEISVDFPLTRATPPTLPSCATLATHAVFPLPVDTGGISFTSLSPCPLAFVYGIVSTRAVTVVITLASGASVRTRAIGAPPGLSRSVKYFAARVNCGSRIATISGLDVRGSKVAGFTLPSGP